MLQESDDGVRRICEATAGDIVKLVGSDYAFTVLPAERQSKSNEQDQVWLHYPNGDIGYTNKNHKISVWIARDWPEPDVIVDRAQ